MGPCNANVSVSCINIQAPCRNTKSMDTRNANPQKNPCAGLLYTPSGVHDKTLLIADPARQTGWNLTGGSPKYLSHATAPKSNFALSGSGLT